MICGVSCLPAGAMCETFVNPKGSSCPTKGSCWLYWRECAESRRMGKDKRTALSPGLLQSCTSCCCCCFLLQSSTLSSLRLL